MVTDASALNDDDIDEVCVCQNIGLLHTVATTAMFEYKFPFK